MRRDRKKRAGVPTFLMLAIAVICVSGWLYGCGTEASENEETFADKETPENEETSENTGGGSDSQGEEWTEKNPDIFAWIEIPDTAVDYPVLQSGQSDTYYENHNADGEEDAAGAVYIELANLTSMCDFNTVLHGKTGADKTGLFADLHQFADPDFFADHEYVYLYLDDNVLIYEVFAAYERENTSLIRTYDFTYLSGCRQFLDDLYATRDMKMNLREGWENVNENNFLITLTTQGEDAEHQFVVAAVLIQDTAGAIDRIVTE